MKASLSIFTIVLIFAILTLALTASGFVLFQYQKLDPEKSAASEATRMQNGVFAMYDVVRAHEAVEAVLHKGHLNGPEGDRLFEAADFLFARTEAFRGSFGDNPNRRALHVIEALGALLAALDAMMATPDELSINPDRIHATIRNASMSLIQFYDQQKDRHNLAVQRQKLLLKQLVNTTLVLILTFMIITSAAVFLWREEYLGRIRRREAENRANQLAYFDALTGLPNRANFVRLAARQIGTDAGSVLFMIDLDDFKLVNDAHGHHIGDAVLRLVGARLSAKFGEFGGMAARLGGDEFGAILPDATMLEDLQAFIDDLIALVSVAELRDGVKIEPRISVGAAISSSLDPATLPALDPLMRAADYALYEAKSAGRYEGRIYNAEMATRLAERRNLRNEMPAALARGEFFVEFQPQFDLKTRKLHGFEALARWRRHGSFVPPDVFIEIAGQDDFVSQLDTWVLREALKHAVAWNQISRTPIQISANISAQHFRSENLISEVQTALERSGMPPGLLTLEVTERVLLENWSRSQRTLRDLSAVGIRIALDDFGTGFSSLSYLKQLQIDEVKVDPTFFADLETSDQTEMMFDALVDISRALGMTLTIEGIETPGQAEILSALGGDIGQGYLFSWPITPEEARKVVLSGMRIRNYGPEPPVHGQTGT